MSPGEWEVISYGDPPFYEIDNEDDCLAPGIPRKADAYVMAASKDLLAACEAQKKIIRAQSDMLVAYRVGGRPSEKALQAMGRYEDTQRLADTAIAKARRGFTLIELMVVMLIILVISAIALPTIVASYSHRQVSEAGRIVQGAFVGARDNAIRNNRPSGIRLLPDPVFMTASVVVGQDSAGNSIIGPDFPRLPNGPDRSKSDPGLQPDRPARPRARVQRGDGVGVPGDHLRGQRVARQQDGQAVRPW